MIEHMHDYLVKEVEICSKKENTFTVLAVVVVVIELIVNFIFSDSEVCSGSTRNQGDYIIFIVSLVLTVLINAIFLATLYYNNRSKTKARTTLSAFYSEHDPEISSRLNSLAELGQNIWPMILVAGLTIFTILLPLLNHLLNAASC
jgi:hypothetical protein